MALDLDPFGKHVSAELADQFDEQPELREQQGLREAFPELLELAVGRGSFLGS